MKFFCKKYGALFAFIFLFPYVCSLMLHRIQPKEAVQEPVGGYKVTVHENAGVATIPLDEYIRGILATVIPIDYEEEALKAQAVILRTELIRGYMESSQRNKVIDAENLSYTYLNDPSLKQLWKEEFVEKNNKLKQSVEETEGMTITYGGIPITAPFFAVSCGRTRNGEEVLGSMEYPYLVSAEAQKDILAQQYTSQILIPGSQFADKLQTSQDMKAEDIHIISRDSQGYVLEVEVEGQKMIGEDFRKQLGLKSANFTVEQLGSSVCFTTSGIGHGLGFSQYGANEMAKEGKSFLEILPYYYTGVQIEKQ